MYVVCNEHLDIAIDEFLEEYIDQVPDLYEIGKVSFTDWATPSTCHYCDHKPKYLVL